MFPSLNLDESDENFIDSKQILPQVFAWLL